MGSFDRRWLGAVCAVRTTSSRAAGSLVSVEGRRVFGVRRSHRYSVRRSSAPTAPWGVKQDVSQLEADGARLTQRVRPQPKRVAKAPKVTTRPVRVCGSSGPGRDEAGRAEALGGVTAIGPAHL
jgi:hypothetical protein